MRPTTHVMASSLPTHPPPPKKGSHPSGASPLISSFCPQIVASLWRGRRLPGRIFTYLCFGFISGLPSPQTPRKQPVGSFKITNTCRPPAPPTSCCSGCSCSACACKRFRQGAEIKGGGALTHTALTPSNTNTTHTHAVVLR